MKKRLSILVEKYGKPDWYKEPRPFSVQERGSILDRFYKQTKRSEFGCLIWQGTCKASGYGMFSLRHGVKVSAHRWILQQTLGERWDPRLWVLHKCDVPSCVNVQHLYQGTARDNYNDMVNRGREAPGAHAKLTAEAVTEIRNLYMQRRKSYKSLASMFNVSRYTIQAVIRRETWKHVT